MVGGVGPEKRYRTAGKCPESRELAGKGWGLPAASRTQMGTCPQQARAPTCFSGQLYGRACWEVLCAPQG